MYKKKEPRTREEKAILQRKRMLARLCKECGREYHIPNQFCRDCWHDMQEKVK